MVASVPMAPVTDYYSSRTRDYFLSKAWEVSFDDFGKYCMARNTHWDNNGFPLEKQEMVGPFNTPLWTIESSCHFLEKENTGWLDGVTFILTLFLTVSITNQRWGHDKSISAVIYNFKAIKTLAKLNQPLERRRKEKVDIHFFPINLCPKARYIFVFHRFLFGSVFQSWKTWQQSR